MLLSISTTHRPATDLSFLLHKHPDRFQSFDLSFGQAHVFYPEATQERCTACLALDVDPVEMVRGKRGQSKFQFSQYVNDRPYVASSFLSVAISQVFGSAMQGRSKERPDLASHPLPLIAHLEALPVRGGEAFVREVFEPLGYSVTVRQHPLDEQFPAWGSSPYFAVTISKETSLAALLTHLYVLVPVFDNQKHYFVGQDELDKLVRKGEGWLAEHPRREAIARRFLRFQPSLYREALARLVREEEPAQDEERAERGDLAEQSLERTMSLNDQRHGAVLAALRSSGAKSVIDLGCGEGRLLCELMRDKQFDRVAGMDVSIRSLELAKSRLRLDRAPEKQAERVQLFQGSLTYRDRRLRQFDAAAVVEVVEHLDPPRLAAFERVVFEFARPATVVLTTPNRDYNAHWPSLPAGKFRHSDHRFEWSRAEFRDWAERVGARFGYESTLVPIGPTDAQLGSPTQMAVFKRRTASAEEASG
jgi:3' terminal RNA ribose 2'-O-methyltransferase Hen1